MIDSFGLAVSHGLLLLVAWRLVFRPDLDDENAKPKQPFSFWKARKDA